jgi:hypothetical protein
MQRIVVAAKAGADQPWLADAAAELAQQTGAAVSVVSLDGLDVEALSPTPRSEFEQLAQQTVDAFLERLRARTPRTIDGPEVVIASPMITKMPVPDDRAEAERGQVERADRAPELGLLLLGRLDENVDRLGGEDAGLLRAVSGRHVDPPT